MVAFSPDGEKSNLLKDIRTKQNSPNGLGDPAYLTLDSMPGRAAFGIASQLPTI